MKSGVTSTVTTRKAAATPTISQRKPMKKASSPAATLTMDQTSIVLVRSSAWRIGELRIWSVCRSPIQARS
jgi:hypothetical protein